MADEPTPETPPTPETHPSPTRFFLRGLATSLPPILTLVILFWIAGAINTYVIAPTSSVVRYGFALAVEQSVPTDKLEAWEELPALQYCGTTYLVTKNLREKLAEERQQEIDAAPPGQKALVEVHVQSVLNRLDEVYVPFGDRAVPYFDYAQVAAYVRRGEMPTTAVGIYMELVTIRYFKSGLFLSAVAVSISIILLYFLGRFVTVKMGRWMFAKFETGILEKVPLVSNVYSSVKQVTDFFFTERTVSYNRVVALEYPRKGIWSIGFVTGDGMREISAATGEPMLSILMPTSPMPMTGFTVTIARKDVVDLDITIDQAFQFCLSCGVLIPPQQKPSAAMIQSEIKRLAEGADGDEAVGAETAAKDSGESA